VAVRESIDAEQLGYDGSYGVTNDTHTHRDASLSDGKVIDDKIECPFHQEAFNFRSGVVTTRPCVIPLRTCRVTVIAAVVFIAN
jgi:nitrite reductase/ring-hydroxylating ferredoxin subunit